MPFSYGIISSLINIFKGKKVDYTEFINISLLNYSKIIKLFGLIFIKLLPYILILAISMGLAITVFDTSIINTISDILFILVLIIFIFKLLDFNFTLFINYNNPTLSCKEILEKSKITIKNNKFKSILLLASFILWFLIILVIVTLLSYFIKNTIVLEYIITFLLAIITPSITISQYVFYDDLTNENK